MHRALYILTPTTELSGEYKCSVSTFTDEDFMIGKMVVIGKPISWITLETATATKDNPGTPRVGECFSYARKLIGIRGKGTDTK